MNTDVTRSSFRKILVLCVDIDDDLGRKTGIKGPVIGREENLKAATALAVADPTEADANAIFGAVRVYEQTKEEAPEAEVEVVTVTGHPKTDLRADQEIIRQMDAVTKRFKPDFIILVSDGADDERVIPLLLRYCQTISVRRVIVQQSRNLEETYFLLKKYIDKLLESPETRAIALGVPGIAIFLAALFYLLGLQRFFLVGLGLTIGLLLLDKAFNIVKTLQPSPGKTSGHIEFTRDGRFALLSIWEMEGALIVYDAESLKEVKRIPMKKPVGKYNVYNKINRSEGTSH